MPYSVISVHVIVVILAIFTGCEQVLGQDSVNVKPSTQENCYCLHELVDELYNPLGLIFYMDNMEEHMLVVEQRGLAFRFKPDGTDKRPIMDIRDRLHTGDAIGDNRGLLSVAVDPDFDTTRNLYAYYIRKDGDKEYAYVSKFHAENGVVDHTTETYFLRVYQPFTTGNGGPMFFGDDGHLYIVTGDGGEEDDPKGNAQNKNSLHGKVLRLNTTGEPDFTRGDSEIAKNYAVPKDNPFYDDNTTRDEIFALGVRNMWGCSVDTADLPGGTGRIFCAETGTDEYDEINIIESGKNYGWNIREGSVCVNKSIANCPVENEGRPIYEFKHNASHALVGGYVYRGKEFDHMTGVYTFGDTITGQMYFLMNGSSAWESQTWSACPTDKCASDDQDAPLTHILAFGRDYEGELYVLMTDTFKVDEAAGKLFKLVPPYNFSLRLVPQSTLLLACAAIVMCLKSYL